MTLLEMLGLRKGAEGGLASMMKGPVANYKPHMMYENRAFAPNIGDRDVGMSSLAPETSPRPQVRPMQVNAGGYDGGSVSTRSAPPTYPNDNPPGMRVPSGGWPDNTPPGLRVPEGGWPNYGVPGMQTPGGPAGGAEFIAPLPQGPAVVDDLGGTEGRFQIQEALARQQMERDMERERMMRQILASTGMGATGGW